MARPIDVHVQAARQLLSQANGNREAGTGQATASAASAGRVYETLSACVAPVIGEEGMRMLFARSLRLTQTGFPCLSEIRVTSEPTQDRAQIAARLTACLSQLEPAASLEAATALYATFLRLMTHFIGDGLVRQIVNSAFPAIDGDGPKEIE